MQREAYLEVSNAFPQRQHFKELVSVYDASRTGRLLADAGERPCKMLVVETNDVVSGPHLTCQVPQQTDSSDGEAPSSQRKHKRGSHFLQKHYHKKQ